MKSIHVFLSTVVVLLCVLSAAAGQQAGGKTNGQSSWTAAPTCCKDCQYDSSCCCAAKNSVPVKQTVYKKTVTQTIVKNTVAALARRHQDLPRDLPAATAAANKDSGENAVDQLEARAQDGQDLVAPGARHLCPICPSGVQVAKTKNGQENPRYCCPKRKTVKVTVSKTLTIKKTVTRTGTSGKKMTATGRVWYDLNKNNQWDGTPIDEPIANSVIYLVKPATNKGRASAELGKTTTDAMGIFNISFPEQAPGTSLSVVKDLITRSPLLTITTPSEPAAGSVVKFDVPVARPSTPTFSSTNVKDNLATVTGRGVAGNTAHLYCNATECSLPATIRSDGSFVLVSAYRKSGLTKLSITQMDASGRESDIAGASQVTILSPPTVTSLSLSSGNTANLVGTGAPGAAIQVYNKDGAVVGNATVSPAGTWTAQVPNLPDGPNMFMVSQQDSNGVSDMIGAGCVTVAPQSAPSQPQVSSARTTGSRAIVDGTGTPGMTIQLLSLTGDILGEAKVGADGTFSVVSRRDLVPGTIAMKLKQINGDNNLESNAASAGKIGLPPILTGSKLQNSFGVVSGNGKPGASITLYHGSSVLGTATVDGNGNFTVQTASALTTSGTYVFAVSQTDDSLESAKVFAPSIVFTASGGGASATIAACPTAVTITSTKTLSASAAGCPTMSGCPTATAVNCPTATIYSCSTQTVMTNTPSTTSYTKSETPTTTATRSATTTAPGFGALGLFGTTQQYIWTWGQGIAVDSQGNQYYLLNDIWGNADMYLKWNNMVLPGPGGSNQVAYIIKISQEGHILWHTKIEDSLQRIQTKENDYQYGAVVTPDDNFLFVSGGFATTAVSGGPSQDISISNFVTVNVKWGELSPWIVKLRTDTGAIVWADIPSNDQFQYTQINSLCMDPAGNLYGAGAVLNGRKFSFGGKLITSDGGAEMILFKYDTNMTQQWVVQGTAQGLGTYCYYDAVDNVVLLAGRSNTDTTITLANGMVISRPRNGTWIGSLIKVDPATGALIAGYMGNDIRNVYRFNNTYIGGGRTEVGAAPLLAAYITVFELDLIPRKKWVIGGNADIEEPRMVIDRYGNAFIGATTKSTSLTFGNGTSFACVDPTVSSAAGGKVWALFTARLDQATQDWSATYCLYGQETWSTLWLQDMRMDPSGQRFYTIGNTYAGVFTVGGVNYTSKTYDSVAGFSVGDNQDIFIARHDTLTVQPRAD